MERLHLHTVQQLQLELADARERSGAYSDESHLSQTNSKDVSQFGQSNGNQLDATGGGTSGGNPGVLPNGNADNVSSFASTGNPPAQVNSTWSVIVINLYKDWCFVQFIIFMCHNMKFMCGTIDFQRTGWITSLI